MENRKQPEVRFRGYTDDWEKRKLDDSIKVMDGDRGSNYPHDSDFSDTGDTLFLDTGNVTKNGFKFDNVKYITKEKNEQLRAGKLEKNDFVLTSRGTLGNIGFYDEFVYKLHPKLRINSAMLILRNTDEQLSYSYLHTLLNGKLISDFMRKNQVGSAQPHIAKSEFLKLDLNVPSGIEEQNKIGDLFKKLDSTIALHQRKLDLLKEQKKGFLQKMFPKAGANTPEIRFAGFTDDWEQRKLSELYKTYSGMTPLRSDASNFENPDIPWIKTTDLRNTAIKCNEEKISDKAAKKLKLLPNGTVLIAMYGGFNQIGRTGLLTYPATINQALTALEPIKEITPYFLLTELNYRVNDWKRLAASSRKDPNITKNDVDNFNFYFPKLDEQIEIGSFFKQLDDTIALHQKELDILKETKKGFLQKMFV